MISPSVSVYLLLPFCFAWSFYSTPLPPESFVPHIFALSKSVPGYCLFPSWVVSLLPLPETHAQWTLPWRRQWGALVRIALLEAALALSTHCLWSSMRHLWSWAQSLLIWKISIWGQHLWWNMPHVKHIYKGHSYCLLWWCIRLCILQMTIAKSTVYWVHEI